MCLSIAGMDGSLDALLGNGRHEIQISQLQANSTIRIGNGSLTLKVPEKCPFGLRISALSIVLPASMTCNGNHVKSEGENSSCFEYQADAQDVPVIHIVGNKSCIVVENQDWFASLGLKFNQWNERTNNKLSTPSKLYLDVCIVSREWTNKNTVAIYLFPLSSISSLSLFLSNCRLIFKAKRTNGAVSCEAIPAQPGASIKVPTL